MERAIRKLNKKNEKLSENNDRLRADNDKLKEELEEERKLRHAAERKLAATQRYYTAAREQIRFLHEKTLDLHVKLDNGDTLDAVPGSEGEFSVGGEAQKKLRRRGLATLTQEDMWKQKMESDSDDNVV